MNDRDLQRLIDQGRLYARMTGVDRPTPGELRAADEMHRKASPKHLKAVERRMKRKRGGPK